MRNLQDGGDNIQPVEAAEYGDRRYHLLAGDGSCDTLRTEVCSLHWHNEIEFSMVTEGTAEFRVEDREFRLSAGDVLFVGSRQIHMRERVPQQPCAYFSLSVGAGFWGSPELDSLNLKYIQPILSRRVRVNTFFRGDRPENAFLVRTLQTVRGVLERKPYAYELRVRSLLCEIFCWIYETGQCTVPKAGKDDAAPAALRRVLDYINRNFAGKITLETLAELSHYSADYLIRAFSRHTGRTPVAYVNFLRLRKAESLLADGSLSVSDIALSVGFNHSAYFSKLFKRQFGCSPSEYRRRFLKNAYPGIERRAE